MIKKRFPAGYIPSKKDAEWFINSWREVGKFSATVDAMFRVCQDYPNNNNLKEVLIKCAVIDNFSSTNVFDLYKMADHIVGKHIDKRLKNGDYSLVDDIAKVGQKRTFYSFASKYCHYHNPKKYAIYDSYVAKVLCYFLDKKEDELRNYNTFMAALNDFSQRYSLKKYKYDDLDKYLWRLGRWYLNPYEPTPQYFHREDQSPYPEEDIRTTFWETEREFMSLQDISKWKAAGKEWLETENEIIKSLSSIFTPDQLSLIMYIYEKFDKPSWIVEYGNGINYVRFDDGTIISRDEAIKMLHKIDVKTNGKSEKEIDTLIRENLGLNFNEEPIDYIPMPSIV
jgi:hypothetical protein